MSDYENNNNNNLIGTSSELQTVFFKAEDILNTLIKFLGTEEYEMMFESIENTTEESTFKAGLMLAPSIIYAHCRKFYGKSVSKEKEND